jgi:GTP-binding protein
MAAASPSNPRSNFIDSAAITVVGGRGGSGSASLRHEPYTPRGGPDGGDGGRGGSVVLLADRSLTDLAEYARRRTWRAPDGLAGAGGLKDGRAGADLVLKVPVGTLVVDEASGEVLGDLDSDAARLVVAPGGVGGRGNVHFKSPTNRTPRLAEPGRKGQERRLRLELKLIADVGLVGPPNAGKSSLLRALTAARPKVADYPFTTLDPVLGVAEGRRRFVVADVPGLIEGASRGAGLGLRFLKHLDRTRVLVEVVDGSRPDPWRDLEVLRAELNAYSEEMAARPVITAVNKVDLPQVRELAVRGRRPGVMFVSALSGEGLPELVAAIEAALARLPAPEPAPPPRVRLRAKRQPLAPLVARRPWGFELKGERVERLVERTDFDSPDSLQRFQVQLDRIGASKALEEAGAQPGDTVRVGELEFEYQP